MDVEIQDEKVVMNVNDSTLAIGIIIVLLTFIGCSSGPPVVPEEFQSQIDPSLIIS